LVNQVSNGNAVREFVALAGFTYVGDSFGSGSAGFFRRRGQGYERGVDQLVHGLELAILEFGSDNFFIFGISDFDVHGGSFF
jgi:hypothetical protein